MRILFVGSLPPVKDGIAVHNYNLLASLLNQKNIEINFLPSLQRSPTIHHNLPRSAMIDTDKLGQINYDVIHFQFGNSYPNSYVFKVFNLVRSKHVKIVSTLHDTTNTNIAKLIRSISSQPSTLLYELNKPSIKEIIERSNDIIVYSNFMKEYLNRIYDTSNKIRTSYIGSEFEGVNKRFKKKQNQTFTISSFGYITPRKGYETVIRSLTDLPDNLKYKYYIIGKFNFLHYKIYLHYLIKKLNLTSKVSFLGYLSDDKSNEILNTSDIIIQPRLYSNEGASASLTAALASGNAVITTNIGSFSEYVENMKTGLLVKHSENDYRDAILNLYNDENLRIKLGESARIWSKEHLSPEAIAKMHISIYKS